MGTVTIESNDESEAEIGTLQEIDKSLGKVCFGYNTEALIDKEGFYLVDVIKNPTSERVTKSLTLRWSYVAEDPKEVLTRIESIKNSKRDLLDLAIAYYRLSYKDNPLRIECFFSCLTVLIRDISGTEHVITSTLKKGIKSILAKKASNFDEKKFEEDWEKCYAEERCSIAHGRGSRLIDMRKSTEYEKITNTVHAWTRAVL